MSTNVDDNRKDENISDEHQVEKAPYMDEASSGNQCEVRKKFMRVHTSVVIIFLWIFIILVYVFAVFMPIPNSVGLQKLQLADRLFVVFTSNNLCFFFIVMLPYLLVAYGAYLIGIRVERKRHSDILDHCPGPSNHDNMTE